MNEFPVLAAVTTGIAAAAGGFWMAFTKFSEHIRKELKAGEDRCQERINELKAEVAECREQIEKCKGAKEQLIQILGFTRDVTTESMKKIFEAASIGLNKLD